MLNFLGYTGDSSSIEPLFFSLQSNAFDRKNLWQNPNFKIAVSECFTLPQDILTPQPYIWDNYVLIADCRIDNREELAQIFNWEEVDTKADIEYIAQAFKLWGRDCAKKLLGDFVFLIYETQSEEILVFRDHFGVRPFYYCQKNNNLIFSSEIKGVLAHPLVEKKWNERFIAHDFSSVENPKNTTLYEGVLILPPASFLSFKNGELFIEKYWQLEDIPLKSRMDIGEIEKTITKLFFKAVKNRLRTSGNIGAEVSGGLDSTGIAAVALEQLEDKSKFYTYSFGKTTEDVQNNLHRDDNDIVADLCKKYGVERNWEIMREDTLQLKDLIYLLDKVYDEPDRNGVPLLSSYFIKKGAEKGVKVMFSGWAGDQIVTNTVSGFYDNYGLQKKYKQLWKDIRRKHSFYKAIPRTVWYAVKNLNSKRTLNFYSHQNKLTIQQNVLQSSVNEKYKLHLQPSLRYHLKNAINIQDYYKLNIGHFGIQQRTVHHFLTGKHYGVEYRFPMLDVLLIEFIYSLPLEYTAINGQPRYWFSKIIRPYVPAKTVNMRKSRFATAPFAPNFFSKIFQPAVDVALNNEADDFNRFFDKTKIQKFAQNSEENKRLVKVLLFYALKMK